MKGVSQIVLVLLILMIAMSVITVLWLNFYGLFQKITSSGTTSTLSEALSTCMKIDSASSNKIYLRNCGSGIITNSSLRVYLDEAYVNFSMSPQTIDKEGTGIITLYGLWSVNIGENHKIKITSPSAEVERFVKAVYSSRLFSDEVLYFNFDEGSGNKTYDTSPYHSNGDINASGRNQVRNPSFENDKQDWASEGDGDWQIVTDEKYYGIKSSRFRSLVADGSYQCIGYVYIPVTQDESITISLYSKGENIVQGGSSSTWDNAYLYGRWINSTGGVISGLSDPYYDFPDLLIGSGTGTWDWERSIGEAYRAPPGAVSYRFIICLGWNATGTLWVDAVQLEYDDKATDFRDSSWVSENSYDYVCSSANEYDDITVSCPGGKVIGSIDDSVYTDVDSPASCSDSTPAGFCPAAICDYPCNCTYPYENCIGKNSCSFNVNNGNCLLDSCQNYEKKLILNVSCKYWAGSKFGKALEFDGVDDYVNVSNIPINISAGAYNTVTFWMYWRGSTNQIPFNFGNPYYDLWIQSSTCMGFNTGQSDAYGINPTGLDNKWVFVALIFYNGAYTGNNKIYINGEQKTLSQCTGSAKSGNAGSNVFIGRFTTSSGYFFNGLIDELRIWNRSLSQSEIQSITPVSLTLGELT